MGKVFDDMMTGMNEALGIAKAMNCDCDDCVDYVDKHVLVFADDVPTLTARSTDSREFGRFYKLGQAIRFHEESIANIQRLLESMPACEDQ